MRNLIFLSLLFSLIGNASGQVFYTPSETRADLEVFKTSLQEAHPGLYTYFNQEQVAGFFDKAEDKLQQGANGHVLHGTLLECISSLRDAHTNIHYPYTWNSYMGMDRLMPFHFLIRNARIYISQDKTEEGRIQVGSELLAVNGIDVITLQQRLNKHTPCDGNVQNYKNELNGHYLSKRLMYLYPACNDYEIRVKTPAGETVTTVVAGISEKKLYAEEQKKPLDLVINEASNMATLTLRSFNLNVIEQSGQHYFAFLENAFKAMRKKEVTDLIIDIRNNGGGDNDLAIALYTYLSRGNFSYLSPENGQSLENLTYATHANIHTSWSGSQWSNVSTSTGNNQQSMQTDMHDATRIYNLTEQCFQDISKNKFNGRVQVLTNPATFSAASIFASVCQGNARGELVGEGTGEACDSFCGGDMLHITLPNSGIILTIPLQKAIIANASCKGFGREVRPDVLVIPSISDRLEKRDIVLHTAIHRVDR